MSELKHIEPTIIRNEQRVMECVSCNTLSSCEDNIEFTDGVMCFICGTMTHKPFKAEWIRDVYATKKRRYMFFLIKEDRLLIRKGKWITKK